MPTTTSRASILNAVNQMLTCIGEAPISSLVDEANEDSLIAEGVLNEVILEVLEGDWEFNRDCQVTMSPDADGLIAIPETFLRFEHSTTNYSRRPLVDRGGYLYDTKLNTDIFTEDILLDVVYLLEWSEIPQAARSYIAARASRKFADRLEKDPATHRFLREDEAETLVNLRKSDAKKGNYKLLDGFPGSEYRASYGRRGYSNVW